MTKHTLDDLRRLFGRFRADERCRVTNRVREVRAEQLRKWIHPEAIDERTFNREIWSLESESLVQGEPAAFPLNVPPPDVAAAQGVLEALDQRSVELHGNYCWRPGSTVFGPKVKDRTVHIRRALEVLVSDREPIEKIEAINKIPGFGPGTASGLVMLFNPNDVLVFNQASRQYPDVLGESPLKDHRSGHEWGQRRAKELGARDLIELDLFLYLVQHDYFGVEPLVPENRILYGPPGTGKTYATARVAVEMCDGAAPPDPDRVRERYRQLREQGRIEFVTFHQSYSYEDFVEGIRPVLDDEDDEDEEGSDGQVRFECRRGIFRSLCAAAEEAWKHGRSSETEHFEMGDRRIWKMSLGRKRGAEHDPIYEECIDQKLLRMGYGKEVDFDGCEDEAAIRARLEERHPGLVDEKAYHVSAVHTLKNKAADGDLVVVSYGNHAFRAIGEITGPYRKLEGTHYAQARPVRWLRVYDEPQPKDTILDKNFSMATIYELKPRVVRKEALAALLGGDRESAGPRRYVLIIDEINRGNIAKILGELITLLEPDKRLGAKNELTVKLPYSQKRFGVPPNLNILGTMNTADRSIAFLDVALRRRFRFEAIRPDSNVVREIVGENGVVEGVDVAVLLDRMNARIEALLDRDHTIGHAYVLSVKTLDDLRDAFRDRLVPLLHEYFLDDQHKVAAVLNCAVNDGVGGEGGESGVLVAQRAFHDLPDGVGGIDLEDVVRYELNPLFLDAAGPDLATFFTRVTGATSP